METVKIITILGTVALGLDPLRRGWRVVYAWEEKQIFSSRAIVLGCIIVEVSLPTEPMLTRCQAGPRSS